jgi:hypothetical protein
MMAWNASGGNSISGWILFWLYQNSDKILKPVIPQRKYQSVVGCGKRWRKEGWLNQKKIERPYPQEKKSGR